jgi:hypothetical protein
LGCRAVCELPELARSCCSWRLFAQFGSRLGRGRMASAMARSPAAQPGRDDPG